MSETADLETLLEDAGGMGRFQWVATVIIYMGKAFCGWSVLQMAFAGIIPDFHCERSRTLEKGFNVYHSERLPVNMTLNKCSLPGNSSFPGSDTEHCNSYNFTGPFRTIMSEFDLVCDKNWVKSLVTSIQMVGLLVGSVLAGQLGDTWGRWKTNVLCALIMALSNVGTAFANSWEVFAFGRFMIGVGLGGSVVTVFILTMEFMTPKWRPVCGSYPAWPIGVCFFSLSAYLLQDWRSIQVACGVCGLLAIPWLLLIPESPRWLTVHGHLDQAQMTIDKIARWNGKPPVAHATETLQAVYEKEKQAREGGQKYTYMDVFRTWSNTKTTIIISYHWFCYSLLYYGIGFGISSLAGDIFLNILLLGLIDIPATVSTLFFNRILGRKWTAAPAVSVALCCVVVCMVLQLLGDGGHKSHVITGLSLVAKSSVNMAWMTVMTWGSELYPTVIRNLGFGIANMSGRVAGILAPFILDFDSRMTLSYCVVAGTLGVDLLLLFLLPDTKDKVLQDSFHATHLEHRNCTHMEHRDCQAQDNSQPEKTHRKENEDIDDPEQISLEKNGIDMPEYLNDRACGQDSRTGHEVSFINTAMVHDEVRGIKL